MPHKTHNMKLKPFPFEMIKSGHKTIELRLYDEKRQKIKESDVIVFTNTDTGEKLTGTVIKLHRFATFDELYKSLPLLKCGYTTDTIDSATPDDMNQYYSVEEQSKFGVVGIELCMQKNNKLSAFLENAILLANSSDITPLLYGSLGLEYLTGKSLNADDIDILIPKTFLTDRWNDFQYVLSRNGYTLIDEHEHTFEKNGIHYSYAQIEELENFAGILIDDIKIVTVDELSFKLLSLPQYLKVYTASAKDGYRANVRNKKDNEKIKFIEELQYTK